VIAVVHSASKGGGIEWNAEKLQKSFVVEPDEHRVQACLQSMAGLTTIVANRKPDVQQACLR
jgi:hypothetical protein